jgi:hypothetical protein
VPCAAFATICYKAPFQEARPRYSSKRVCNGRTVHSRAWPSAAIIVVVIVADKRQPLRALEISRPFQRAGTVAAQRLVGLW